MTLHPQGWRPKRWSRTRVLLGKRVTGAVVPPPSTALRETRRYKSSRRAGKNWPKRPPGVSQGKPPEGTACVFMPSSSYEPFVRLFLTEDDDLTTLVILDTGSGLTLISRQLLPVDTSYNRWVGGPLCSMMSMGAGSPLWAQCVSVWPLGARPPTCPLEL